MTTEQLETEILSAFREVLRKPDLTADDDFFSVGGDSLLAVEVSYTISESLGQEVDPLIVYVNPTATSCASAVAEATTGDQDGRDPHAR
ncbi:hypothetical protein BJF83_06400 [Nocardiopsis sp. CNR-923]|uniref:phosphopantetheine-binding protein n=1 Tax=Nocardiopsis sp. CNR-923 TaxID=1904965 RepID=UPI0009626BD1|nr:phosphopantetheine-binding protein [Nocardiopsis sp. CNR-923]OLT24611.1 hypothetical protein BJF83_06400 [Nocardiopsis sp. CNR-923]